MVIYSRAIFIFTSGEPVSDRFFACLANALSFGQNLTIVLNN